MPTEYVRICPVCEAINPADRPLCACGAALAGVDFSLPPAPVPADAIDTAVHTLPTAASTTCPHADCGQPNPVGGERCLYCNRPLREPSAVQARLRWPWGEATALGGTLVVGREAPAPPDLAARLEREFANVSRRHAQLRFHEGVLTLTDLGSLNGTFVDGKPLPSLQSIALAHGQTVRFGSDLSLEIDLTATKEPHGESDPA